MKAQFSTKESEVRSLQEQLSEKEEKITTLDARVKEGLSSNCISYNFITIKKINENNLF